MSDIKPVLTAEEWEVRLNGGFTSVKDPVGIPYVEDGTVVVTYDSGFAAQTVPEEERHALAALALYGQPFGFTREDVELLRGFRSGYWETGTEDMARSEEADYENLADRIEALLPAPPTEDQ